MSGFITSRAAVNRHGVFAEERRPSPVIQALGTGVVGLVGQFPWGPDGDAVTASTDVADRLLTFAPPGMTRTGSAYLALICAAWPDLRVSRVLGTAAAVASATLQSTAVTRLTVALKYKGAAGNTVEWVIANASDGDANKFNLTVQTPGGAYAELYQNINVSGVGADSIPDVTGSRLVGSMTKGTAGRPTNGSGTFSGGSDGVINAARYTGVAGTGDYGIAAFENDRSVRQVFVDDCGNTDRATINTALRVHATLMGERLAVINGNSGLTSSAAITAAALDRSARVVYVDPWVYVVDEDGTERLMPPAAFFASVCAQIPPSLSPAWKDATIGNMLARIRRLQSMRGAVAGTQTEQGITTIIDEESGGFRFEAAVTTIAPSDAAKKRVTRTRMGDFIATAVTTNLRSMSDAPNVPVVQDMVVGSVESFLAVLKRNAQVDPFNRAHILDYAIGSLAAANSAAELANGDFTIPAEIQTSSGMERIFFSVRFGENVTVSVAA
jgi:hypothetical protein